MKSVFVTSSFGKGNKRSPTIVLCPHQSVWVTNKAIRRASSRHGENGGARPISGEVIFSLVIVPEIRVSIRDFADSRKH